MKATINSLYPGQVVKGRGTTGTISNKTNNSVEIYLKAKNPKGISCHQWVTIEEFNKEFTV
jgi:hypothetical protein